MSEEKHVLIIGAGASCELGFPDGQKLAAKIGPMVTLAHSTFDGSVERGDRYIWDAISHLEARRFTNLDLTRYVEAGARIARGMPQAPSIDSYMASNAADKEVDLVGRLAIVRAILLAEAACPLLIERKPNGVALMDFGSVGNTWLNRFWHRLANGCVEQFMYHAIQNYYNVNPEVAQSIMRNLTIYHPYGTVGRLPWQPGDSLAVKFGQDQINPNDLLHLAQQNIKTITEQAMTPSDEVGRIRAALQAATTIISLGFAFHSQNMKLLAPDGSISVGPAQIYVTAKGVSKSDRAVIENDLRTLRPFIKGTGKESVYNVDDLTCVELFDSYRKSLEIT